MTIKNSLKQRKRSKIINKSNIDTSGQSGSPANPHEYRLLSNALGELEEFEEDDINLEDGDTDIETCIDADTAETKLAHIMEVTKHLVHETLQYAKVSHNDTSFTFSEDELQKYIGVLLFSGYHILLQQYMYWEWMGDISTPMGIRKVLNK